MRSRIKWCGVGVGGGGTASSVIWVSDIEAARTNGISCIAVTYGDGDEIALLSRNPAYVARDIAELNDIMTDTVIHARSMI